MIQLRLLGGRRLLPRPSVPESRRSSHFQQGHPDRAFTVLDRIPLGPWIHLAAEVPECALVAERRLRAEAHAALGHAEEAEAWRTLPATLRPFEWVLLRKPWFRTVDSTNEARAAERYTRCVVFRKSSGFARGAG